MVTISLQELVAQVVTILSGNSFSPSPIGDLLELVRDRVFISVGLPDKVSVSQSDSVEDEVTSINMADDSGIDEDTLFESIQESVK